MIAIWNRKLVFTTYRNEEFVCASNALKQHSIDYKVKVKSLATAGRNGTVATDIMMEKDQKSAFYYLYVDRKNVKYASEVIHKAIHS